MKTLAEDKFKDICTAIEKKPNQAYKLTMMLSWAILEDKASELESALKE